MARDIMLGGSFGLLLGAALVHVLAHGTFAADAPERSRREAAAVVEPHDDRPDDVLPPLRPGSARHGQRPDPFATFVK